MCVVLFLDNHVRVSTWYIQYNMYIQWNLFNQMFFLNSLLTILFISLIKFMVMKIVFLGVYRNWKHVLPPKQFSKTLFLYEVKYIYIYFLYLHYSLFIVLMI